MIIKCPRCLNAKAIKQIDQKRELGLMVCHFYDPITMSNL